MLVSGSADWTVRCWDVKSAGGMANKARENGLFGGEQSDHHETCAVKARLFLRYGKANTMKLDLI